MQYSIFDAGVFLASYEDEGTAIEALVLLASENPECAERLVFVAFDDDGARVGEPVLGSYFTGD